MTPLQRRPRVPPVTLPALLALAPALALAACGAGDRPGSAPVVRDSAGITIVENSAPTWHPGEEWTVVAEPEVEIGVLDGEAPYQLYRVAGAVRLSDGRIVIANGGSNELRYFAPDGRHVRSVGREGDGPGEFRFIGRILRLPGDSVLVSNLMPPRHSLFDEQGTFVRTVDPAGGMSDGAAPPLALLAGLRAPPVAGRLANGTFVAQASIESGGPPNGLSRPPTVVLLIAPGSGVADTIARLPGTERDIRIRQQDGRIAGVEMRQVLFGRSSHLAVAADRIYAGANDTYEIGVYVPGAGLTRLIRRTRPNRPLTQAIIDEVRRRNLENARDDNERRAIERQLAEAAFPETLPAFSDLEADAAGRLWVKDYTTGDDENRWDVFEPDGRWLGTVVLPRGFNPTEIGEDYVLGIVRDDLGVERVRVHRIEKGG